MGLVYVAEQTEPVRRRVALKVIKAGMDTRAVILRFEAERQALAVMDHPNIAKVLDGGTTDDGLPYFVMELVKGSPLTEFCDAEQLTTSERLALFIDVCHAVQHAHQKGVIHRDLKPSNVLVAVQDDKPVPKVIDFGIAKALAQPLAAHTLMTDYGHAIGTPAYMSPEQADPIGSDVDTRTDIYSLGVMLYEMLTDRLPVDPGEVGMPVFMMRLASKQVAPATPSARLSTLGDGVGLVTQRRKTEIRALRSELKGDLDWIVMKALDPDRARRYETVNGLAMDIERHLRHEPVVARPPSKTYRLSRFVRRNRGAVVAGALVVLALVAGMTLAGAGLLRARRAEALARHEAENARQVSNLLVGLFKVSDPSEARGNSITAREILDRGAASIRTELTGQPLVQAEMMQTVGVVYRELGLFAQSQPLLESALAIRLQRQGADDAGLQSAALELARLAQQQGRFAVAESLYRATLAVRERSPGSRKSAELLLPLSGLGGMLVTRGRFAEAESLLTRAVVLHAASKAPEDVEYARLQRHLASAYLAQGRFVEAEPAYLRALATYERTVGKDHPDVGRTLSNLGVVYYGLKRYDDAERQYLRAEANLAKTLGADHPNIASININLGEIAWRRGRLPEAKTRLLHALEILAKRVDANHPSVATAEFDLANVLRDAHQFAEAEARYTHALQIRETALGTSSPAVAEVLNDYARMLRETGKTADADRLEARARTIPAAAK
jgi:eukaryotic-like serine/threonine-protein kinase